MKNILFVFQLKLDVKFDVFVILQKVDLLEILKLVKLAQIVQNKKDNGIAETLKALNIVYMGMGEPFR